MADYYFRPAYSAYVNTESKWSDQRPEEGRSASQSGWLFFSLLWDRARCNTVYTLSWWMAIPSPGGRSIFCCWLGLTTYEIETPNQTVVECVFKNIQQEVHFQPPRFQIVRPGWESLFVQNLFEEMPLDAVVLVEFWRLNFCSAPFWWPFIQISSVPLILWPRRVKAATNNKYKIISNPT